jgi:formylglycine-generating enzyme required for sulfatase activity
MTPSAGPKTFSNSLGMTFVRIEPGSFEMGTSDSQLDKLVELVGGSKEVYLDEAPRHRVEITRPFYLGRHEVTVGQFRRFVDATGYKTDAEKNAMGGLGWDEVNLQFPRDPRYGWRDAGFPQTDDHSVMNVSWNDARAFAEWLSRTEGVTYRVPTEAEWEYASRAGSESIYPDGDSPSRLTEMANLADASAKTIFTSWRTASGDDGQIYTAPVGTYPANAWGLHDMLGNVWEWCEDDYDARYYASPDASKPDPLNLAKLGYKSLRGGGWIDNPGNCRPAHRYAREPYYQDFNLGFRLATSRE